MIIVIQCAGRKVAGAGYFQASDGRRVCFVGDPYKAPDDGKLYARPDDSSDEGPTWRALLLRYQRRLGNPFGLLPAYALYDQPVYARLADGIGPERLYILSAGWGLIPGTFLTPVYDITLTAQRVEPYKRRGKSDPYNDFRMLRADTGEPIVFLGGQDYLPLFVDLTSEVRAPKTVVYAAQSAPSVPGYRMLRYETMRRTNWHYGCAGAILAGEFDVSPPS